MQLLMRRPEVQGFISLALPANMYDFSFLAPCPSSGLIVHGEKDALVPTDSVERLVQKLHQQRGIKIDLEVIQGADHFFNSCQEQLEAVIEGYLDHALPRRAPARPSRTPASPCRRASPGEPGA